MHQTDPLDAIPAATPRSAAEAMANAERIRARNDLAEANLPLVAYYVRCHGRRGVDPGDLMGVGSVALLRAAERYDPARGAFGVFAGIVIRQAMRDAIARAKAEGSRGRAVGGDPEDADVVPDPSAVPPLEAMARAERDAWVRHAVGQLPASQRAVVAERFGLDGGGGCTLVEAASRRGVSRQRVHQVEGAAFERLRAMLV